ncbi:hypothetical protein JG687_00002724 [Phytophthora cactorum]|uniref:Uncharacterized protein n=1 Tax=Phytophthora cactorum TaxID=29920 RepID=A0A8T1UTH9_9STRA|nr:hypothetical protein JG687_00002724 [Phytophthora cactorum]
MILRLLRSDAKIYVRSGHGRKRAIQFILLKATTCSSYERRNSFSRFSSPTTTACRQNSVMPIMDNVFGLGKTAFVHPEMQG